MNTASSMSMTDLERLVVARVFAGTLGVEAFSQQLLVDLACFALLVLKMTGRDELEVDEVEKDEEEDDIDEKVEGDPEKMVEDDMTALGIDATAGTRTGSLAKDVSTSDEQHSQDIDGM